MDKIKALSQLLNKSNINITFVYNNGSNISKEILKNVKVEIINDLLIIKDVNKKARLTDASIVDIKGSSAELIFNEDGYKVTVKINAT